MTCLITSRFINNKWTATIHHGLQKQAEAIFERKHGNYSKQKKFPRKPLQNSAPGIDEIRPTFNSEKLRDIQPGPVLAQSIYFSDADHENVKKPKNVRAMADGGGGSRGEGCPAPGTLPTRDGGKNTASKLLLSWYILFRKPAQKATSFPLGETHRLSRYLLGAEFPL